MKSIVTSLALLTLFAAHAHGATARLPLDVPKEAQQAGAEAKGAPRVHAYLLSDVAALTPGETFRVGVLFLIDEHYHIYWKNPGQAALATKIRFSGNKLTFGEIAWPAPSIFRQAEGFITTYGYADEVLLFTTATVAENARGELTVNVNADYLACHIDCTPGQARLSRTIPLQAVSTPAPPPVGQIFERHAARVPRSADELGLRIDVAYDISAVRPGTTFNAAIGLTACAGPPQPGVRCPSYQVPGNAIEDVFIPERIPGIELKAVAAREHPHAFSGLVLDVVGKSGPDEPEHDARFAGVLELEREDGTPALVRFEAPLPRTGAAGVVSQTRSSLLPTRPAVSPSGTEISQASIVGGAAPQAATGAALGIWEALALAFLGGIVLNLMPCVLPVLAIKVTSYTETAKRASKHGRAVAVGHALAYTGGILAAMLGLAGAVLLMRAGGHAVGWGFQFQEPVFVTIVAGVLTVFALSLFGLFEVHAGGVAALGEATYRAHGPMKSALEGVLAVVVATPCSAPYLGSAVGFALAGEAWLVPAAFSAIGLGLAAPFVLLTVAPQALAFVPKPGMWMVRLKQLMGFALLATVLWLAWVAGTVAGLDGMTAVLGFALTVGLATWMVSSGARGRLRWLVRAAAVAAVGTAFVLAARFTATTVAPAATHEAGWQAFAPEHVASALQRGKVVFVDFTAEWCITCKMNERAVLGSDRVAAMTKELDVVLLKADWTRRDEAIRAELARYGKAGVPMYLVYSPRAPNAPQVLPELLTTDLVVDALQKAHDG